MKHTVLRRGEAVKHRLAVRFCCHSAQRLMPLLVALQAAAIVQNGSFTERLASALGTARALESGGGGVSETVSAAQLAVSILGVVSQIMLHMEAPLLESQSVQLLWENATAMAEAIAGAVIQAGPFDVNASVLIAEPVVKANLVDYSYIEATFALHTSNSTLPGREDWTADTNESVLVAVAGHSGETAPAVLSPGGFRLGTSYEASLILPLRRMDETLGAVQSATLIVAGVDGYIDGWGVDEFEMKLRDRSPEGRDLTATWSQEEFWVNLESCSTYENDLCTRQLDLSENCSLVSDDAIHLCADKTKEQYFECMDIDECAVSNGGCRSPCTNLIGSFECSTCPNTTVLSDGFGFSYVVSAMDALRQVTECGRDDLLQVMHLPPHIAHICMHCVLFLVETTANRLQCNP